MAEDWNGSTTRAKGQREERVILRYGEHGVIVDGADSGGRDSDGNVLVTVSLDRNGRMAVKRLDSIRVPDDCTCDASERDEFGNVDRIPNPSCPIHEK